MEVHEPAEHVRVWMEDGIRIRAATPDGEAAILGQWEAHGLADLIRRLADERWKDPPYEPGDSPFDRLMHFVCVHQGYCGSVKADGTALHVTMFIPDSGPVTADQFVEWVFLADNMNPNVEPERWRRHKDAIRTAFVEHMGGEVADAGRLRWSVGG